MITLFIIILVLVCILLMAVVLLQAAKGGGISSTFGGSNVTAVFGTRRTSDFLSKATIVLASIFLLSSLLLNLYISKTDGVEESIIQQNAGTQQLPPPTIPTEIPGNTPPTGDPNQQTTPGSETPQNNLNPMNQETAPTDTNK